MVYKKIPFMQVSNDFRPNTNGIESLSTLVSPRVGQMPFDPSQKL